MFIVYLRTMVIRNVWLDVGVKLKGKNIYRTIAMLF
jgi:hypothetical protein